MQDLVIIGAGGCGRDVHQLVEDINQVNPVWNCLGFLDENKIHHGSMMHDLPILGNLEWLVNYPNVHVTIAVGNSVSRYRLAKRILDLGNTFATLVHPQSWIGNRVILNKGAIVCAGVRITTDVKIGMNVILNLDCTIAHDTVIADYVTLAPGVNISGGVRLNEGCDLGTNCAVIQKIDIGPWSIIGAGAVVVNDIPPNVTAVGVPAKPIKERVQSIA